ncbi:hypothetical protein AAKU61_002932 [Undibacterium sp. GrIS 1.2]|uniref:hypothetical protein n=1 Tax=Undibacterium sp. GrIS 1.2 TaxID=3143933 RepID=UPI003398BEBC
MSNPTIIKQHAEDAATKWWRRGKYLNNPRTRFDELVEFDQSIDTHLDGLREAGNIGVERAYSAYETAIDRRAEDVSADGFVVLALAFLTHDMPTIHAVIAQVAGKPGFAEALNGVFAWLTSPTIAEIIEAQFPNQEPIYCYPALRHGHAHAIYDSVALKNALQDSPPVSLALAIDAVANCGRIDLLALILDVLNNSQPNLRTIVSFSAAQGALLLGDRHYAIPALLALSLGDTSHSIDAMKLLSLV